MNKILCSLLFLCLILLCSFFEKKFFPRDNTSQYPDEILNSLNETEAIFTKADILNEISKLKIDEEYITEITKKVFEKSKCIGKNDKEEPLYTGMKYYRLERSVLSKFKKISIKPSKIICKPEIISDVLEKYSYMSDEQKFAVKSICGKNNIDILVGKAGTGKTTTLKAIS